MQVFHQTSADAAVTYYNSQLSEYYGPGGEKGGKGIWFGAGCDRLGIKPGHEVDQETFEKLSHNIDPSSPTGERLTARNREGRRVLTDLTFSLPKSCSIVWSQFEDNRMLDAAQEVALETLKLIEQDACTRVNKSRGMMTLKKTGEVVGAGFLHTTSRPIDGHPDPQIHFHGTVFNCTYDRDKDRYTAVDLSKAVKDSGYYKAVFMSKMAARCQELGYTVERSEHNFEITGISRELIEKFSRRHQQIDKAAEAIGTTNKEARSTIALKTRSAKGDNLVPPEQLHENWRSRLSAEEATMVRSAGPADHPIEPAVDTTRQALNYSLSHNLQNQSVVRTRQVLRDALLQGIGGTSLEQLTEELDASALIRAGAEENEEITTHEMLAREEKVVRYAKQGRGRCKPINTRHKIERDFLSEEQRRAVHGLLSSTDRVSLLLGKAGVGKTTIMKETISGMEEGGKKCIVLAPQSETAHGLLRDREGFDANTVASFLLNEKAQDQARGQVLWIDEAGQLSLSEMERLIDVSRRIDARCVLSGDRMQHQAVGAGSPLKQIEDEAGVKPFTIDTIRRQTDEDYREAVTAFSKGNVARGLEILDAKGYLHEIADDEERALQIAEAYAKAIEKGESTVIVSPSNAEREWITEETRNVLKLRGHIDEHRESSFEVLVDRRLSNAKKSDTLSYTPGKDIIEFHRKARGGWEPSMRAVVAKVQDGKVFAESGSGLMEVPIDKAGSFNVYRSKQTDFAPGDLVRITKNKSPEAGENSKRLNNGSVFTLQGFSKDGELLLSNGQKRSQVQKVRPEFGHLDHGLTLTSYASQGKDYSRVLVAQGSMSAAASSREQAYVSTSRGKHHLEWFTDSVTDLKSAVERERPDKTATELERQAFDEQARRRQADRHRLRQREAELRRTAMLAHVQTEQEVRA